MSDKKKKKEKVVYYDDGSTISDMSGVKGGIIDKTRPKNDGRPRRKSTFGEKWRTYWAAVKMMILPMLGVLLILVVLFIILSIIVNGR